MSKLPRSPLTAECDKIPAEFAEGVVDREARGPRFWPQFCHFLTTPLWAQSLQWSNDETRVTEILNLMLKSLAFEIICESIVFKWPHFPGEGPEAQKSQAGSRRSQSQHEIEGHNSSP